MNVKMLLLILNSFLFPFAASTKFPVKPIEARTIEQLFEIINSEFEKKDMADLDIIVEAMNQLSEDHILNILRNRKILAGEHLYDSAMLWKLHEAALRLGPYTNIALCLRRTNKFQSSLETKLRVKDEIMDYLSKQEKILPKWLDFNDLAVIEDRRVGLSHPDIVDYFKVTKLKLDDDTPWCAAYVAAKLRGYDPNFTLPAFSFKAASFGGFSSSNFMFKKLKKNQKGIEGRYESLEGFEYLPYDSYEKHNYTMDDFKDKNKIPFGSIVVFKRTGGGHVGFVVGTIKEKFEINENGAPKTIEREGIVVFGGNQNDAVQFEVFFELEKIRAVTIPSSFSKDNYCAIPELTNMHDLPELYDKKSIVLH